MNLSTAFFALTCALLPALPAAADQSLESRVDRVERILSNQSLSDLQLRIQRLQQETQQLRGQIERQQHEITTLKTQQRDQYLDGHVQGQTGGTGAPATQPDALPASGEQGPDLEPQPSDRAAGEPASAGEPDAPPPLPTTQRAPDTSPPSSEKDGYRIAFDLLKQRRYDEAAAAFEALLARYPKGEYTDNARYWLGEANYVKRDYPAALIEFQRVLTNFPQSPKAPGALLKIGYIQSDQNDVTRARATLQDVIQKYPDTTEARLAQSRLDRITRDGR